MDTEEKIKQVTDLNLKSLADDFSSLLTKHLGGDLDATTTNFTLVEREPGGGNGITGLGQRIKISFQVEDRSWIHRLPFLTDSESDEA